MVNAGVPRRLLHVWAFVRRNDMTGGRALPSADSDNGDPPALDSESLDDLEGGTRPVGAIEGRPRRPLPTTITTMGRRVLVIDSLELEGHPREVGVNETNGRARSGWREYWADFREALAAQWPFGGSNDDVDTSGDDPTFQQLLLLAGLFCGPIMYLIGGSLFCVMPPEHRRSRQWAFFNMVLALLTFGYVVANREDSDINRPIAAVHVLEPSDHFNSGHLIDHLGGRLALHLQNWTIPHLGLPLDNGKDLEEWNITPGWEISNVDVGGDMPRLSGIGGNEEGTVTLALNKPLDLEGLSVWRLRYIGPDRYGIRNTGPLATVRCTTSDLSSCSPSAGTGDALITLGLRCENSEAPLWRLPASNSTNVTTTRLQIVDVGLQLEQGAKGCKPTITLAHRPKQGATGVYVLGLDIFT